PRRSSANCRTASTGPVATGAGAVASRSQPPTATTSAIRPASATTGSSATITRRINDMGAVPPRTQAGILAGAGRTYKPSRSRNGIAQARKKEAGASLEDPGGPEQAVGHGAGRSRTPRRGNQPATL